MAKVRLRGNKALISKIQNMDSKVRDAIEESAVNSMSNVRNEAVRRAPRNEGVLAGSIREDYDFNALRFRVVVGARYGAIMEFGTGTRYKAPPGLDDYASEFKGKLTGSFEDFKASLKRWMQLKGIEEKYLYPILMKILRVGIEPQPFLFPAWFGEMPRFRKDLKSRISNAIKK